MVHQKYQLILLLLLEMLMTMIKVILYWVGEVFELFTIWLILRGLLAKGDERGSKAPFSFTVNTFLPTE